MSANDSESDLSSFLLKSNDPEKKGKTASNAVNTEELLASLSMLNLTGDDESEELTSESALEEIVEKAAEQLAGEAAAAEPMRVIGKDQHLSQLFNRVQSLLKGDAEAHQGKFVPQCPETLDETGLTQDEIERLILKFLLAKGTQTGRQISRQIKLPFGIIDAILKRAKQDQLVAYGGTAEMGDYEFTITELGRERARRYTQECTYFGAAPVCFKDYLRAMEAQSIAKQEATEADLKEAFSDLIINPKMLDRLGPAVNSGRGMFLFGEAGNGKTSIAERITKAFG
ncbi:MAG: AAA family ATPase, partial [Planctomycetaceae bacterium]|nr:AAA family ATPase [Planctomycetaceae bacterium]